MTSKSSTRDPSSSVTGAPHVSALILAGGKATRLGGIAKHEIVVDGETIFARQVRLLAPRVAEILVAGPAIKGYRRVTDTIEGAGPLAGIAAGLAACRTPWLLVIAGDMPHITDALIDALLSGGRMGSDPSSTTRDDERDGVSDGRMGSDPSPSSTTRDDERDGVSDGRMGSDPSPEIDAVGVRVNGLPEPLLCVLHTGVLPVVERAIAAGRFKASRILTDDGLRVRWLDADPEAVRNINSPEDLGETRGSK